MGGGGGLTGFAVGATLEVAVVTTCLAGISRLWPAAVSLAEAAVAAEAAGAVGVGMDVWAVCSQAK